MDQSSLPADTLAFGMLLGTLAGLVVALRLARRRRRQFAEPAAPLAPAGPAQPCQVCGAFREHRQASASPWWRCDTCAATFAGLAHATGHDTSLT